MWATAAKGAQFAAVYNYCLNTIINRRLLAGALTFLAACLLLSCSASPNSSAKLTPAEAHGQRLFQATCARCHRGDTTQAMNGPGLQGLMRKQYLPSGAPANDERLHTLIVNGRGNMPALGQMFDEQQINDIIAYLHRL